MKWARIRESQIIIEENVFFKKSWSLAAAATCRAVCWCGCSASGCRRQSWRWLIKVPLCLARNVPHVVSRPMANKPDQGLSSICLSLMNTCWCRTFYVCLCHFACMYKNVHPQHKVSVRCQNVKQLPPLLPLSHLQSLPPPPHHQHCHYRTFKALRQITYFVNDSGKVNLIFTKCKSTRR